MARKKTLVDENDVKAQLKKWFEDRGAWSYAPVQNGLGVAGIHDRVGCVPVTITSEMVGRRFGLFVSIEAKRPGRRGEARRGMTAAQAQNVLEINNAGGISLCYDGGDDDVFLLNYLVPSE